MKNEKLKVLHKNASQLIKKYPNGVNLGHIPRADNFRADELSNLAMDRKEIYSSEVKDKKK